MNVHDRDYYRERARAEQQCAADATNPVAHQVHLELARLYEKLAGLDDGETPRLSIAPERRTA